MSVKHTDSVEKVASYLKAANADEVVLSSKFFRDYTCPSGCGGCCPKFTLDYVEGPRLDKLRATYPEAAARLKPRQTKTGHTIWTDAQSDNDTRWCRHLRQEDGRCGIHEANPFTCEFELLKLNVTQGKGRIINKLFGRGWSLLRVDGERGAKCEMLPYDGSKLTRDVALLDELRDWAPVLGYDEGVLPRVVGWLKKHALRLQKERPAAVTFRNRITRG